MSVVVQSVQNEATITETIVTAIVQQINDNVLISTIGAQGLTGPIGATGPAGADGDRYRTTSNSTLTIAANGTITLYTTDLNLDYTTAQTVIISYNSANHMHGEVVSYDQLTGALVVSLKNKTGSGTYSSWQVNLDGAVGIQGEAGRGITSITRTSGNGAAGTTDTYTILYSDLSSSTFTVVNGANGSNGRSITSITRTNGNGAAGTTDTYTILYSDLTSSTFTVVNGANGSNGTNGLDGFTVPVRSSGEYYVNNAAASSSSSSLPTTTLYFVPIYLPAAQTITKLGLYSSTAGTNQTIRLGLYSNLSNKPNALLQDFGTFTTNVASTFNTTSGTSYTLTSAGWYWVAVQCVSLTTSGTFSTAIALPWTPVPPNTTATSFNGTYIMSITAGANLPTTATSLTISTAGHLKVYAGV